ncbi:serine hydrolase [Rhodobacterales bacterium HKCCE3408]|nr:serine hydrolase [Rhodobacterales bacterium HKCCE3408]
MIAKRLLTVALVTLAATFPGYADPLPADRLQAAVDETVAAGVPGAVLFVETADGETWAGASGVAALDGDSTSPGDHFRLFSITKTIVAATAFTLIDEGTIGLDDPIGEWLDTDLIGPLPNSADIAVRDLIAQTSGIRDYQDDRFIGMIRENFERVWTPEELVAHAADGEAVAPPGSPVSYYSNTNYALLGLIIERASGMPLSDAIRARVLAPLGATETYAWSDPDRPEPVNGYFDDGGQLLDVSTIDLSVFWASGDLISTAADTARLLRGILAGDLLSEESRALMTGDFRPLAGRPVEYGYGTFRIPQLDPAPIGHSGEGPGGGTVAVWWPDDGTVVVVLTNLDNGAHVDTQFRVADVLGR